MVKQNMQKSRYFLLALVLPIGAIAAGAMGQVAFDGSSPGVIITRHGDDYVVETPRERHTLGRRPPRGSWAGETRLIQSDVRVYDSWVPSLRCGACDLVPNRRLLGPDGLPLGITGWLGGAHGYAQEVSHSWAAPDGRAIELADGQSVSLSSAILRVQWIGYSDHGGERSASIHVDAETAFFPGEYRHTARITSLARQSITLDYSGAQGAVTPCHSPAGAWTELSVDGASVLPYGGQCPQLAPETLTKSSASSLGVTGPVGSLVMEAMPGYAVYTRKGEHELKSYWRRNKDAERVAGQVDEYHFVRRFLAR